MTQHSDIERLLDHWFKDGPDQASDRVVDIVTDRIERQSQRPAWRLDWRPFPVNAYAKIAVAAAAILIVAVVGYNLFPGSSTGVGGPAPSASPTQAPSPTPSTSQGVMPLPDSGLTAGRYSMDHIDGMTITATVPDRWRGIPGFGLAGPVDYVAPLGLAIVFYKSDGAFDDPCHWDKAGTGEEVQPGEKVVGPTVDDLIADIRANASYTSTASTDITLDGHPGKQLDLQLPSGLNFASCDKPKGVSIGRYLPLIGGVYALGSGNIWHLRVIDVDGTRLVVAVMDYAQTPAADQAAAQAILDSIKFSK
jgi:hypothetical protein